MGSPSSKTRKRGGYALNGVWVCHAGRMREANEDACLVGKVVVGGSYDTPAKMTLDGETWIVAVSDGIGGHRAGGEASAEVVKALEKCETVTPTGVRDVLQRISKKLCERGRNDPEFEGMGATIAGIASGPKGLFAFSVGDSRVYKFFRHKLTQVTRDDSEAEELIRQGLLPRDAGVRPGYLHALTQAIGGRNVHVEIHPHFYPLSVATHARFLVCSDGVTDMLPASVLQHAFAEITDLSLLAETIFGLAMDSGGLDNITFAIVDVQKRQA